METYFFACSIELDKHAPFRESRRNVSIYTHTTHTYTTYIHTHTYHTHIHIHTPHTYTYIPSADQGDRA